MSVFFLKKEKKVEFKYVTTQSEGVRMVLPRIFLTLYNFLPNENLNKGETERISLDSDG
jgi:hypothetical protein